MAIRYHSVYAHWGPALVSTAFTDTMDLSLECVSDHWAVKSPLVFGWLIHRQHLLPCTNIFMCGGFIGGVLCVWYVGVVVGWCGV